MSMLPGAEVAVIGSPPLYQRSQVRFAYFAGLADSQEKDVRHIGERPLVGEDRTDRSGGGTAHVNYLEKR